MAKKPLTIWFDEQGDLLDRASNWTIGQSSKWEEAQDFEDTMEYEVMRDGGNSSGRAYFNSAKTGRKYSMFLDDFNKAILARKFVDNVLQGTFRFVKRGQAQGIKLILPPQT